MLYSKTAPVGVDIPIQQLQTFLHDELLSKWGLQNAEYQAFGRCYRNQKGSGYVAEVYVGDRNYKEVQIDDRFPVLSFFGIDSDIDFKMVNTVDVHLIFWVNIQRVKPTVIHRADEEVRKDVELLVKDPFYGFKLTGIRTGIERVLQEYQIDPVKFRDMHPFHCFRFDFSLQYDINIC